MKTMRRPAAWKGYTRSALALANSRPSGGTEARRGAACRSRLGCSGAAGIESGLADVSIIKEPDDE